jgi:uncharacterized protein with PIN domain
VPRTIHIRFYEELNDFLPHQRKKTTIAHEFFGSPTIKDIIESLNVPHTEVDLVLANSQPVSFSYRPLEGDLISVYPVFESLDVSGITLVRRAPLRRTRFILDVHLGKLARYLRMLGFDTLYENDYSDDAIVRIAEKDKRIVLTRDIGILKNNSLSRGYWVRSQHPSEQVKEVVGRLHLSSDIKPFNRCIGCNGTIVKVSKEDVIAELKPLTRKYFTEFYRCRKCKKVYWNGTHYQRMSMMIDSLKAPGDPREEQGGPA